MENSSRLKGLFKFKDLSNAFDTVNNQRLMAKLHTYGFSKDIFEMIPSYLSNRWQRVKVNPIFNSWT